MRRVLLLLSTDDAGVDVGLARISQMLKVRRVDDDEELHEDLIGEMCGEDDDVGDELILLGERIRLVNEPNFVNATGVVAGGGVEEGGDGDGDGFVFNLSSSLPVEGTVISNLSSLIRKDSGLERRVYICFYRCIEKVLFC